MHGVISLALKIDDIACEGLLEENHNSHEHSLPRSVIPVPTEKDVALSQGMTVSPQRQSLYLLWKEGSHNHFLSPMGKTKSPPVIQEILGGATSLTPLKKSKFTGDYVHSINFSIQALIDSGAEQNLISRSLVEELQIPTVNLTSAITVSALTRQAVSSISLKNV